MRSTGALHTHTTTSLHIRSPTVRMAATPHATQPTQEANNQPPSSSGTTYALVPTVVAQ